MSVCGHWEVHNAERPAEADCFGPQQNRHDSPRERPAVARVPEEATAHESSLSLSLSLSLSFSLSLSLSLSYIYIYSILIFSLSIIAGSSPVPFKASTQQQQRIGHMKVDFGKASESQMKSKECLGAGECALSISLYGFFFLTMLQMFCWSSSRTTHATATLKPPSLWGSSDTQTLERALLLTGLFLEDFLHSLVSFLIFLSLLFFSLSSQFEKRESSCRGSDTGSDQSQARDPPRQAHPAVGLPGYCFRSEGYDRHGNPPEKQRHQSQPGPWPLICIWLIRDEFYFVGIVIDW